MLEYLTLIPEEVSNIDLIGGKKLQIAQELKESIPHVLSTLSNFLFSAQNGDIITLNKSLKCFQSWIQYGIDIEQVIPLLQQTMVLLDNDELFESASDVLLEGMQQVAWTRYNSFRDELLVCFTSDGMKKRFTDCMTEEDEEIGRPLAKLFTTFIETFTDYVSIQLARYDIKCLMEMVLQLTGFNGYYPVDQEISEIPLNVWYVLQETLYDNGVIPIRLWIQQCGEAAIILYRQLVSIIKQKAVFPDDITWQSWTKGDTIINSYYVLRGDMLGILFDHLFSTLNNWNTMQSAHLDLEATLFCLKSVSEEIPTDENEHIAKLFESNTLQLLTSENNTRLQVTSLALMGALAEWLKGHPQFLAPVMNYIVPRLGEPKLSFYAASAFSNICDICRESLKDGLDSLMNIYGTTAASIMKKVVESVASVIQVLPPDRSIGPLMILTGSILREMNNLLNQDPNQSRDSVISQLENLSSCCRGIQAPTDDYQSLSTRNDTYDSFATGQLTAVYNDVDGFKQMTNALTDIIQRTATIWSRDEEVMKSLSQFLEAGIRSTSPLLTLTFEDLIILIENGYKVSEFASWLDISSFAMTVYGGQEPRMLVLQNLLISLTEKTLSFISTAEGGKNEIKYKLNNIYMCMCLCVW
ncbi:armadillo-type protein [Cunninghamella echinulata]|nr:armadillo-type protein [Cunninghamella echinulata]